MNGLLYSTYLQWKLDFRNKGVFLTYYIVPLVFYGVMGSVFTGINPFASHTLIQSMTIFAVSMGAFLGTPTPLVELFSTDTKKTYQVGNIPLWTIPMTNFFSGLVHMFIVSMIIFVSAPLIFKADIPNNPAIYFLVLLLFIAVCLQIGLLIGLISKKAATVTMLSQFVFLPSLLLSGIMFPANLLPAVFIKVSNIFPATQAMKILTATQNLSWNTIRPLFIIGVIIIVFLFAAYKRVVRE